jgi:hypothetical protein
MIGAIPGIFEIQDGSPVVRKVLRHLAGSTGSPLANIALHGDVKGVSTDDMVNMSGRMCAWLAGGVKSLKGQS